MIRTTDNNTFNQLLSETHQQLASACSESVLAPHPPQVIAVSKQQPVEKIEAALAAGHRHFGENRIQNALSLWPDLKSRYPDTVLHLIGPLQSNKAHEAVALFDVIHTVDRQKIAESIKRESEKQSRAITCFIQVNAGEESQKSGVLPGGLVELLNFCNSIELAISGLMCIPPAGIPPAPYFALLYKLAQRHRLAELSMGMSGDYETAARLGATYVRIGTALFGERNTKI